MERKAARPATAPGADDGDVIEGLRRRDEHAFRELVDTHSKLMLHVAREYVGDSAVAEEVVQETWIAVIRNIDEFEQRSSLKTWIFRILTNTAVTRAARERRTVPMSALARDAAVARSRFLPREHPTHAGWWVSFPRVWPMADPEALVRTREIRTRLEHALAALPEQQRVVLVLRDIEGWSAEEVSTALDLSAANQRVLLHRARAKVRRELERHFGEEQR